MPDVNKMLKQEEQISFTVNEALVLHEVILVWLSFYYSDDVEKLSKKNRRFFG